MSLVSFRGLNDIRNVTGHVLKEPTCKDRSWGQRDSLRTWAVAQAPTMSVCSLMGPCPVQVMLPARYQRRSCQKHLSHQV